MNRIKSGARIKERGEWGGNEDSNGRDKGGNKEAKKRKREDENRVRDEV